MHFLFRMRFLVKRWHKTTGISSTTSGTVSKNGAGQLSGRLIFLVCFHSYYIPKIWIMKSIDLLALWA